MGCAASKVEDLPAVALCRDRCKFLGEALSQTQALAEAHGAYLASLKTLGPALHRFLDDIIMMNGQQQPPPPPPLESEECSAHHASTSNSDSHIQFPSDSDSDSECKDKDPHKDKQSHETPTPVSSSSDGEYFKASGDGLPSKPPPPPPSPISSTWDLFNLFDAYDRETYLAPLYSCSTTAVLEHEAATPARAAAGSLPAEKSKTTPLATSTTRPSVSSVQQAEAMRQLHLMFDRAAESGNQVLNSLRPHHHTISLNQEYGFDDHQGLVKSSKSLSYTLKMLFLWENKLYDEVKAEERLRVTLDKKSRMLKHLEHNKGTTTTHVESPKINSLGTELRNLFTKMKISIQIVDRISITINKLRDEELWPQIIEFIHRLLGMWMAMAECHKSQYQAIAAAKCLDAISISNVRLSGEHERDLETAIQLKLELQNWKVCFSKWIATQKGYVKSLNGWLLRCLVEEPQQVSPDQEMVPLSPGRVGAPPVFVICNQWCEAVDRLSEKEVIEAIRGFHTSIHLLLMEQQINAETFQQRMGTENKDLARRKVRLLEEEEEKKQKILHKVVMRGRGKTNNTDPLSLRGGGGAGEEGRVGLQQSENNKNMVGDLKQILMAMEKFTANSVQAYKDLHAHIEQVSSVHA